MTDAHGLLRRLKARGVTASLAGGGDAIRLEGMINAIPADTLAFLRQCKAELIQALTCPLCACAIELDEAETWWGHDRVHRQCGERALIAEWMNG